MLLYATEFPTISGQKAVDFIGICCQWMAGSGHNPWALSDLPDADVQGIHTVEKHDQTVELGTLTFEDTTIAAFYYRWVEDIERQWTSELVARETENGLWVSVRVSCDLLLPGVGLPVVRKPYIIRKLLDEFGGGQDGGLIVGDRPRYLRDNETDVAAALINGDFGNSLPIIYVSADYTNHPFLDVDWLARTVSGSAHVVVEPTRSFSFHLMSKVNRRNAYGGAVGIYWPGGVAATERFLPRDTDAFEMGSTVAERIREALCSVQPSQNSTWSSVRELMSRVRIAELRGKESREVEEWIEAYQEEQNAKEQQLTQAFQEIERLKSVVRRLESTSTSTGASLLNGGNEQDLFPGEKAEIVLLILQKALGGMEPEQRACHVTEDIVEANDVPPQRDQYAQNVRAALSGDDPIGVLRGLGFQITEQGKHFKAVFAGDGRYTFSISKTPGDHRAGKNMISQINRVLFK